MNPSLKNANILIVDDTISNIELLESLLKHAGYSNLKSTTDSREVAELYESFQPDLILLDLMMPYLSGYDLLIQLKKLIPAKMFLPILVLTAELSHETRQRALSGGAKDFLSKPFDIDEVLVRIKNLLETRYLQQLLENQNKNLAIKVKERTRELEKVNHQLLSANQELEVLDKAKLEFLHLISHEIRTPLNGIKGFTNILKRRIDSPELLEYLQYLETSADRLEKFSNRALLITELRTQVYKIQLEVLPIFMLLDETKKQLREKIEKKNIQIEIQKDVDLSLIKVDLRLIQICFECLIDNAVKYSHMNATVIMNAYSDSKNTIIEIIDQGVGFSALALKNIFRFFSFGDKHVDQNTGLNLALVKLIMDAHHGEIKVTNNKPSGAIVKLSFKG
ncbi:MAG: response regulator [Paludibacter sp.]